MTSGLKRKARTSMSILGFWIPSKEAALDCNREEQSSDTTPSSSSSSGSKSPRRRQAVSRLWRSSTSRLLSKFGFRRDSDSQGLPDSGTAQIESPSQNIDNMPVVSANTEKPRRTPGEAVLPPQDTHKDPPPSTVPHVRRRKRNISSRSHDVVQPLDGAPVERSPLARRSQSIPGLARRLSTKISVTFGNPTVVHRAELRRRPSLHSFSATVQNLNSSSALQKSGDNAQDDSDPSTAQSGSSSSPMRQSTNPTSDGIHNSFHLKQLPHTTTEGLQESGLSSVDAPESPPQPEQVSRAIVPSIITVEATASAKIFLETYFNELFSGESGRAQRQREVEQKFNCLPLTPEERAQLLQEWFRQENEYLRQDRVLKARSNSTDSAQNVSMAGFEMIKVLGKGSFGVVRLVKENTEQRTFQLDLDTVSSRSSDLNQGKTSTIGALKSAVDGGRSSRRRDLSKMKKEVYAMKVIRKSEMLRNCQEGHLRAERDFLVSSAKSRWIVPLIASFQDAHNLYLVMDYMIGGDFLSLLIRKNILSEDITRWYVAEMILCVEEAHRLRWIHRDIKPDNFLISAFGHLKITDFGLAFDGHWSHDQTYFTNHRQSLLAKLGIKVEGDAKDKEEQSKPDKGSKGSLPEKREHDSNEELLRWRNRRERRKLARSVVGTSQYMAPEVIRGHMYDGRCDWWSIGIILYECLFGFTPFSDETRDDTKRKIHHHNATLCFPNNRPSDKLVSTDAIDLIGRLLQDKEYRICSRKYMLNDYAHSKRAPGELLDRPANKESKNYQGYYVYPDDASDIKCHPFFRRIRWDELHYRKPPFVPKVSSWEDTRYFDDNEPISDINDGPTEPSVHGETEDVNDDEAGGDDDAEQRQEKAQTVNGIGDAVRKGLMGLAVAANLQPGKSHKKKKEKKRPRDKVLRDEMHGNIALNMRKKGAFLGYSYRRPKDLFAALEVERGRSLVASFDGAEHGAYRRS